MLIRARLHSHGVPKKVRQTAEGVPAVVAMKDLEAYWHEVPIGVGSRGDHSLPIVSLLWSPFQWSTGFDADDAAGIRDGFCALCMGIYTVYNCINDLKPEYLHR